MSHNITSSIIVPKWMQTQGSHKVTMVLQLDMLLGCPLLYCPVPVGQHLWADFEDAS